MKNENVTYENVTYEVCPHCGKEVCLDAELSVQACPECGRQIVACSMCIAHYDNVDKCCVNCPLAYLAEWRNKCNDSAIMNTSNGHNAELVALINNAWKERNHDEFKPIIKALIYRDYDECVEKGIIEDNEEMWLEDWDWEIRLYDYLMEVADDTDLVCILNFLHYKGVDYVITAR